MVTVTADATLIVNNSVATVGVGVDAGATTSATTTATTTAATTTSVAPDANSSVDTDVTEEEESPLIATTPSLTACSNSASADVTEEESVVTAVSAVQCNSSSTGDNKSACVSVSIMDIEGEEEEERSSDTSAADGECDDCGSTVCVDCFDSNREHQDQENHQDNDDTEESSIEEEEEEDCNSSSCISICGSSKSNLSSRKSMAMQDTYSNPSRVDKLIAKELQSMNARVRSLVQEEIHGVSTCAIPEYDTPTPTPSSSASSSSSTSSSFINTPTTPITSTSSSLEQNNNSNSNADDCCSSSGKSIMNDTSFIQEEGLKQLDIEIRTIRKEVLFNSSTTHESKDGNTYDEAIWSYLVLDTDTVASSSTTTSTTTTGTSTSIVDDDNDNTPFAIESRRRRILYSYIFHRDFRLKFLRADMYLARKAAHRYLRCLECLLKYFGRYALQRPLMYDDLGKEGQDAAKMGYVQILPSRDRSGRLVVVAREAMNKTTTTKPTTTAMNGDDDDDDDDPASNMAGILKLFVYTFLVVSEDIETQKRGVIFVFSTDEEALKMLSKTKDREEYGLYREGSPVRRSCTHFCLPENNAKMRQVRAIMMSAMSKEERIRTRIHMDGLTPETQHRLMTFGINVSELPLTSTGQMKTKHHLQWIKVRKAIDNKRMTCLESCYNNKTQHYHQQKRELLAVIERQRQQRFQQQQPQHQQLFCHDYHHHHNNNHPNHHQQQHVVLQGQVQQYQQHQHYNSNNNNVTNSCINNLYQYGPNHVCDSQSTCCTYPSYDQYLCQLGTEPIIHPMVNDVLFSKGGKNVTHYGNIEFTDLMKRSLLEYVSSATRHSIQNRKERKAIRQGIIDEVTRRGGRFLTLDRSLGSLPGCWKNIDPGTDLHDRIATSLYDHKRRLAAKLKIKTNRFLINTSNDVVTTTVVAATDASASPSPTKRRKFNNDDNYATAIDGNDGEPIAVV